MPAVDADAGAITNPSTRPLADVRKGVTSFRENDVILAKITPCTENEGGDRPRPVQRTRVWLDRVSRLPVERGGPARVPIPLHPPGVVPQGGRIGDDRAAIMEYDGGMTREWGEHLALLDVIEQMSRECRSPPAIQSPMWLADLPECRPNPA